MKHLLKLEWIGEIQESRAALYARIINEAMPGVGGYFKPPSRRPWVAEILGPDQYFGLKRCFLQPKKDYSQANAIGSRGTYLCFVLEEGPLYEVRELTSWRHENRYFMRYVGSSKQILQQESVLQCLKKG